MSEQSERFDPREGRKGSNRIVFTWDDVNRLRRAGSADFHKDVPAVWALADRMEAALATSPDSAVSNP